ncbi:hypothetical protein BT93_A2238 [Corymbia citriodora subsp. variegata]|nr:hypothetical protein BT93_A2238 [Corymbia citriodora subsp. variegata]
MRCTYSMIYLVILIHIWQQDLEVFDRIFWTCGSEDRWEVEQTISAFHITPRPNSSRISTSLVYKTVSILHYRSTLSPSNKYSHTLLQGKQLEPMANQLSLIKYALLVVALSLLSGGANSVPARHLLDTSLPEIAVPEIPDGLPDIPSLPKVELPPLPEIPTLPKPELPTFPIPEFPEVPGFPSIPSIPKDLPVPSVTTSNP